MGGNNFAGMTKIPHVNIIRDNGKLESGQVLYFNPNTLTLDYSRGKDGSDVPDRSAIYWKQIHLPGLNSWQVSEQDRLEYNEFVKCIREEIREVSVAMIEATYLEYCVKSLTRVNNISTTSDFRKLRSSLNTRVTDLLLELEAVQASQDHNNRREESDRYKEIFCELKDLYDFKYMVKADKLANAFMERNNVVMRKPLNQKKRYTNFITVIFGLKLTAMHKNSFMPMFTRYSADKDGNLEDAKKLN
jgi:hypothetical protein